MMDWGSERARSGLEAGAPLRIRPQQQAVLAEFGRRALACRDIDELLHEAAALAAEGLDARFAKILERLPNEDRLLVRAGVGWAPDVVGRATIGADLASPAGYALKTGKPAVSNDLTAERRFRRPEILRAHGAVSAANVLIQGEGPPFGVLEVDSDRPNAFEADDINFLQGFANLLAAAIERRRTDELLRDALREREALLAEKEALLAQKMILLREMQHRIKNNLQVILSVVELQERTAPAAAARSLRVVGTRVRALGILYDQLYLRESDDDVDLAGYINRLCDNLLKFHGPAARGVRFERRVEPLRVTVDMAVALGLIINEFAANSLEHAVPRGCSTLAIEVASIGEGRASLGLADDGPGLPPDARAPGGLGLRLIAGLAEQIGGELQWDEVGGARLTLTFPLEGTGAAGP